MQHKHNAPDRNVERTTGAWPLRFTHRRPVLGNGFLALVERSGRLLLQECAPDHRIHETDHYYRISCGAKVYPAFPKGAHGKSNPPIEKGHVKRLARFFDIYDCAKAALAL